MIYRIFCFVGFFWPSRTKREIFFKFCFSCITVYLIATCFFYQHKIVFKQACSPCFRSFCLIKKNQKIKTNPIPPGVLPGLSAPWWLPFWWRLLKLKEDPSLRSG